MVIARRTGWGAAGLPGEAVGEPQAEILIDSISERLRFRCFEIPSGGLSNIRVFPERRVSPHSVLMFLQ